MLNPDRNLFVFYNAFAYVLARIAHADLDVGESERAQMKRTLCELASLSERDSEIAVEIACAHTREWGGTDDYLVTRQFRSMSSVEERLRLLGCLFAVAAADGTISTDESSEITGIAQELGLGREDIVGFRARWKKQLAEFQGLPSRK